MDLYKLSPDSTYCVGISERGVGAWTYLTKTGKELIAEWANLNGFLVGDCEFNCPPPSKWFNVQLPDGKWIVVREHSGSVVPDVLKTTWPSFADYKKGKKPPVAAAAAAAPIRVPVPTPAAVVQRIEDDGDDSPFELAFKSAALDFVAALVTATA